jgi:hypothetical protein
VVWRECGHQPLLSNEERDGGIVEHEPEARGR